MYTLETPFYHQLNELLRAPDRSRSVPLHPYLTLFLNALHHLRARRGGFQTVWRGISEDLSGMYRDQVGGPPVVWWSVSSCSSRRSVSEGFAGHGGTLFKIEAATAVSICDYSAFYSEDEMILFCGTALKVEGVERHPGGGSLVSLRELPEHSMVT